MTRTPSVRALIATVVCLLVLAAAPSASAATFVVTRTDDPVPGTCDVGDCSLREAIIAANNTPGPDVIELAGAGAIYTLTQGPADLLPDDLTAASGDLDITESLVINGNGSIVEAGVGLNDRVFHIAGAAVEVTINDLTTRKGAVGGFLSLGGGIYVRDASLTLNHCVVTANSTLLESSSRDDGGGIAAVGTYDAGVVTLAHLTIDNTTVSGNTGLGGGGLVCALCALTIQNNSSVDSNTAAGGDGGGVLVVGDASTVSITKTAITGNAGTGGSARGGALAIPVGDSAPALASNRIASNTAPTAKAIFSDTAAVNAANNWWGCNAGPGATGTGCPVAPNGVAGPVTANPRLVLEASASPSPITRDTHTTATADLRFNNSDVNPAGVVPDATSVAFGGGPGIFAQPSVTTSNGIATNDFTGTVSGAAGLTAALDGQTVAFSVVVNSPPTVSQINAQSIDEDTSTGALAFTIADDDGNPLSVTASATTNASLIDSIALGGSGGSRTITVTPAANRPFASPSETATITVEVSDGFATTPMSFVLTVNAVNDAPTLDPIASPPSIAEDSGVQTVNLSGIGAGAGETQTLTVTAKSDKPSLIPDPTVTYVTPGATGSLSYQPAANAFGTAVITVTVKDDGGTANGGVDTFVRTFNVTVDPVADTPSVTGATTREDTQTTSGLVVTRNADDGDEVTHVKITNVVNGTLFKNDGATQIPPGSFITYAEANAGLKFTPSANFFGTASFDLQASTSAADAGLGGAIVTATITVTAAADTPSVTPASTKANVQTTSGLVISRNAADGGEVTHFKITNVQHGTVFLNDGTTPVNSGDFIPAAAGLAGLKFTPADGFIGAGSFDVQSSMSNADGGLGGGVASAAITVTVHATTTTVVSANPNPSDKTQPITVVYTVARDDAGPAPAGIVTITISGGSETCTGSVAAGQCTLTPTSAGVRAITAAYGGETINAGSTSATLPHTVSACNVDPVVTSAADDGGAGTLRNALAGACYGSTITFNIAGAGPHTVSLGSVLGIGKNVTITGSAGGIVISGNNATKIFGVGSGVTAALNRLTLTQGTDSAGGALTNMGTLTIADSTLSNNSAGNYGGAIENWGALTVSGSTVSNNTAGIDGGGIFSNNLGTLTVVNSTISGNTATHFGGGIEADTATLTHVTITGNSAGAAFGGIGFIGGSIANSIVASNTAPAGPNASGNGARLGNNIMSGDPMLGPLQDNGGPTFTHMPLPGSPALDGGDNGVAADAGLTVDQRGFARVRDAADADTVQTVDIGAVEVDPIVETVGDKTIDEDGSVQFTFNVGDDSTPFDSLTVISGNTTLLPNTAGHVDVTTLAGSRTVTLTPLPNLSGDSIVTITATKTLGGAPRTSTTSFTLHVNAVNDPPTLNPIANPAAIPEDSPQQTVNLAGIGAGGGESQALSVTATSSNTALIPNPSVTYTSPSATGSLAYTPVANKSGTAVITVTVSDGIAQVTQTFTVTVNSLADTPSVQNGTAAEDGLSTVMKITRNPVDGSDVTHYKVTNITGGTLMRFVNGLPAVNNGDFITVAQGTAGLVFAPSANSTAVGHFTVQASIGSTNAGLGGGQVTADITVTSVPDAPNVTSAVTAEDTQTTSGLVITRNAADGPDVTHFKIVDVFNGKLYQHDGVTEIPVNTVITAAQGAAGLRFTPSPNFFGSASVLVIGALDAAGNGNGVVGGGGITVTAVADTPSITNAATTVNAQTTGGLVVSRNPVDGAEIGFVKVTGITGGTLYQNDGTTAIGNGAFITMAQASAGLRFTPLTNSIATGHVTVQASSLSTDAGLGGSPVTASITVTCPAMTLAPTTIPSAVVGAVYSQTFTQSGGAGPITFSQTGALPGGLTFNAATATLSGVPATPGSYPITVTATSGIGCGAVSASYTLLVGGGRTVLTGADAGGGPQVRRFSAIDGSAPTSGALSSFFAFAPSFTGGVRVAEGDVNGDGQPDYIAAAGPGGSPQISVFDGATGATIHSFLAFEPGFTGGVFVAAGDVDGDGYADIIVGSGPGRSGEVKVFSGKDNTLLRDTFVFPRAFTGGVQVAAGDVNADGFADLIVGSGPGMASQVTVLSGADLSTLRTFAPYGGFGGGVFVAAGDVTDDGFADIITGAGAGGGPHVQVFDGVSGAAVLSFFAFDPSFTGGVRVAAGDVTGDGKAEVIVGAGPGGAPEVRVFDGGTAAQVSATLAYPISFTGGVFVATVVPQHRMAIDMPRPSSGGPAAAGDPAPRPSGSDRRPTMIAGWAYVENLRDAGIAAIHVWAAPVNGGDPIFVGVATLGDPRTDIAARFGSQYGSTGFHLDGNALPPGTYDLAVFAMGAKTGTFQIARGVRVTKP